MPKNAGMEGKQKQKNACQIQFDDDDGDIPYRSLYLDTLGEEARRSPSPVDRHYKLHSTKPQRPSTCCEGYIYGTLSTAGIDGASPAAHRQKHLVTAAASESAAAGDLSQHGSSSTYSTTAAAVCRPNLLGHFDDPGMHPKVLIPPSTNRPDLTLSTADIDGAQPWPKDVCHHPRETNPLNPQYRLATGSGIQFSSSPMCRDKPLRDTLSISDIPGAVPRPKTPAARAAAARAAAAQATACTSSSSSPGCACGINHCSRAGVLEVGDIDGAYAAWRPTNRRHIGRSIRDSCLDVSDINAYMARFKPEPRNSADYKGHPQGPRATSPIRPRSNPDIMDNSLRIFDIEGTSVRLAPRATHTTCLDIADIEGAHPCTRDRAHVFAACKAASAPAAAQQEAAQAVLAGLQLNQRQLLQLWDECSRLDRDKSGLVTGQELVQAMQRAQLQLAPADAQQLASAAARNDVAMLNYKKLTRQLKGQVSRPASALAAPVTASASAATVGDSAQGVHVQQRPQSAMPAARHDSNTTLPEQRRIPSSRNSYGGTAGLKVSRGSNSVSRPSSAPARPCKAAAAIGSSGSNGTAASSREEYVCARTWGRNNREGVCVVSHWFCGSRRDGAAADETAHWRPGHAADAITRGWGLNGPAPWDGAPTASCCADSAAAAAADGAAAAGLGCDKSPGHDVVPAWMIGADALQGTCRISHPFGRTMPAAAGAAAAATEGTGREGREQQVLAELVPVGLRVVAGGGQCRPASSRVLAQRPASAGPSCMRPGTHIYQHHQQAWDHVDGSPDCRQQQLQQPMSALLVRRSSPSKAAAKSRAHRAVALGLGDLVITGRSSSSVGLAERRRLVQSQQQELMAVRLLG